MLITNVASSDVAGSGTSVVLRRHSVRAGPAGGSSWGPQDGGSSITGKAILSVRCAQSRDNAQGFCPSSLPAVRPFGSRRDDANNELGQHLAAVGRRRSGKSALEAPVEPRPWSRGAGAPLSPRAKQLELEPLVGRVAGVMLPGAWGRLREWLRACARRDPVLGAGTAYCAPRHVRRSSEANHGP